MSNWIHLHLQFKNYDELKKQLCASSHPQENPSGVYKELVSYLKKIIDTLSGLINRYFYLFEPNPHLFLALELKDMRKINRVKNKINTVRKPNFIESVKIQLNTQDEGNGEAAVDFFMASTKYAFFRIAGYYKPGYYNNDETKLIHCFCNALFFDRINEIDFYFQCLHYRGISVDLQGSRVIIDELKNVSMPRG
jgi:hypothetical protein